MRLAIINSNLVKINQYTKKGTEIFDFILINNIHKFKENIKMTVFSSGDSRLPTHIESVNFFSSTRDKYIGQRFSNFFELALISKAFSLQKRFDLYHANMGCGEYILPFARFTKKPVIITLHGTLDFPFMPKYYPIFNDLKNVFFVSISNAQRKSYPKLNYIRTIYHGIDINLFKFNPVGDKYIMTTGRGVPEKGMDIFLNVIKRVKKRAKLFPIIKDEYIEWLRNEVIKKKNSINQITKIQIDFDINRYDLIHHYQNSKLFLFPVQQEEAFGLVLIESMACGTPIVAFARGSVPEIVKDGETGFIINESENDIRGDWIIKKTGVEGLCEAVNRIYSMPQEQYQEMRKACRDHVEKNFTVKRMIDDYESVYKEVLEKR